MILLYIISEIKQVIPPPSSVIFEASALLELRQKLESLNIPLIAFYANCGAQQDRSTITSIMAQYTRLTKTHILIHDEGCDPLLSLCRLAVSRCVPCTTVGVDSDSALSLHPSTDKVTASLNRLDLKVAHCGVTFRNSLYFHKQTLEN